MVRCFPTFWRKLETGSYSTVKKICRCHNLGSGDVIAEADGPVEAGNR